MDEKSFQGLSPELSSDGIPFQAPAIAGVKVYIQPAFVALFYNANVLIKAVILLFTQVNTFLWKIVDVYPQKEQFY